MTEADDALQLLRMIVRVRNAATLDQVRADLRLMLDRALRPHWPVSGMERYDRALDSLANTLIPQKKESEPQ